MRGRLTAAAVLSLLFVFCLSACGQKSSGGAETSGGKASAEASSEKDAAGSEKAEPSEGEKGKGKESGKDASSSGSGEGQEKKEDSAEKKGSSLHFTSTDIDGGEISDSIFSEKELTVLNVWGTFCGPCIREMPELAEWDQELPENVQLLGLVGDINGPEDSEHIELAKKIMEQSGVKFRQIVPNEELIPMLGTVAAVPTTFLIDKEGNFVGKPIVGARVSAYKEAVEEYLKTKSGS